MNYVEQIDNDLTLLIIDNEITDITYYVGAVQIYEKLSILYFDLIKYYSFLGL